MQTRIFTPLFLLAGITLLACPIAHAATDAEEAVAIQTLEAKADAAALRDQCFLYTTVLRRLADTEGAQMSAGDEAAAASTLRHMDLIAAKLSKSASKDSRRLKSAEELMQRTNERLHDMIHLGSDEARASMKPTLDRLNHLHDEVLNLVFAQ